ncbi:MAG: hypothetical protein VW270_03925 [Candidatus Poseidoniales archaeon]|jgi:hypothetical protein
MTNKQLVNYTLIYEEYVTDAAKDGLEMPRLYADLTPEMKRFVEELVDYGAKQAVEAVLDPEVMESTAELAADMGTQLYQFANMIRSHGHTVMPSDDG